MAIALPHYAKIKDRYCISYFGRSNEYLVQLLLLRPNIEKELQGIQIYIACLDEVFYILSGHPRILTCEQFRENEKNFAYIRNLTCNLQEHPVEALMEESQIPLRIDVPTPSSNNGRCIIMPEGIVPTRTMTQIQIEECKSLATRKGFVPEISNNFNEAAWVIGVENEYFYAAAAHGIPTTLVPTGIGTNLYRKMFERGEILTISSTLKPLASTHASSLVLP